MADDWTLIETKQCFLRYLVDGELTRCGGTMNVYETADQLRYECPICGFDETTDKANMRKQTATTMQL